VGRTSNTEHLALDKAGITMGSRGLIPVNQWYQTAVPHIYAAGDVIGFPALASTAMEQARIAVGHAFSLTNQRELPNLMPYGIWTIPEISTVGATEQQLQEAQTPYVVGRARYASNPRGLILGEKHGLVKLLFAAADGKLLGVHIIGQEACELISIGLTALVAGMNAYHLVNLCFNYPSLSDLYKYAAYDALDKLERPPAERQAVAQNHGR
jgi:NAD(P) transhydrogenase